ncbi:MAG: hypothetical protein L0Z62_46155 [Gemmataceae bacterium]|nr:hypothetical protein [Gemmataceae bacterium]
MNRIQPSRLVLALAVGAFAVPSARADQLDQEMLKRGPTVMQHLQKQGHKNVGVLKFRVQVGDKKPSFDSGRLTSLLATRLENVLILANDLQQPIGITRGASEVAARGDKTASYRDEAGRRKLFSHTYPLAWGDKKVTVNAFLTGLVRFTPDLTAATVTLQEFTSANPQLKSVAEFKVKTNRLMLADMNQTFTVKRRDLGKTVPFEEVDEKAAKDAASVKFAGPRELPLGRDEILDEVLEFELFYDDKPVKRNGLYVPTPRQGQKVHFRVKALKERLGVVLLINGLNTLGEEEASGREPDQLSMWVLEPGKVYQVSGYYTLEKFKPIRVLSESESVVTDLGNPRRGKIEMYVFREPQKKEDALPSVALRGRPISLRPVPEQPRDFKDARARLRQAVTARTVRALMAPSTNGQKAPEIQAVEFNGVLAAYRPLIYYQGPGKQ